MNYTTHQINGKWYAIGAKPRFCFEANTQTEAIEIAERGLAYYHSVPQEKIEAVKAAWLAKQGK